MLLKELHNVTIIGLGLLGGSVAMAIAKRLPHVEVTGFAHRAETRRKVRRLGVVGRVSGDLAESVSQAQLVVLATPVCTFEPVLRDIGSSLPGGCVLTDVGSTKRVIRQWASSILPKSVSYVGSHPMAGSELRGVEAAREDLLDQAICFVTPGRPRRPAAVDLVCRFWSRLGCKVRLMTAERHDRIVAAISHVPQAAAASLVNATPATDLAFAAKGFVDTSRIASGPAEVWSDVFLTNGPAVSQGIDRMMLELARLRRAIDRGDRKAIEAFLSAAADRRARMIEAKIQRKELH
jgi:prephenate dehydrogenase